MSHPTITMATETIHNPDEPRHFMRVKPIGRVIEVQQGGAVIARSNNALRVTEIARDMIDPVVYLPRADILVDLEPEEGKTTYCPLKGHASYFRVGASQQSIAWSYEQPRDFAAVLTGLIAFYPNHVAITETGANASPG